MGFTHVKTKLFHPGKEEQNKEVELLVDTGALFSVVPRAMLEELGIPVDSKRKFKTADGRVFERDIGGVVFELKGFRASAPVIFGEESDLALLGVTTLETLGFEVDPVSHSLKQVPLIQA